LGNAGNIFNSEFLVSDVKVQEKSNNSTVYNAYTTTVNGLSTIGSTGGFSVPGVDRIRKSIFDRITARDSIITENDYERLFEYQEIKPFVDAKFIDAKAFVFLFNVIRENDNIIKSNTFNIKEIDLFNEPFYPELTYNNVELVSPFYYKNKDENQVNAYLVNPNVIFNLQPIVSSPDYANENQYRVILALEYNFGSRKSALTITNGANDNYMYTFRAVTPTGIIQIILSKDNEFKQEINESYTDPYCIIREYWTDVTFSVDEVSISSQTYAPNNMLLYKTPDDERYTQLHMKQVFYKYFSDEIINNDVVFDASTGYLDNNQNDIMSTVTDIFQIGAINSSQAVILRMPYIDKQYFYSKTPSEVFEIMDKYFIVDYLGDAINYNTQLTQSFHNTIDIPSKYYPYIFEETTMPILNSPLIPISLSLYLDSDAFITSSYENITDFEIAVKIKLIKSLKEREGFMIDYYETDIEKILYNNFSPIIRNVNITNPTLFRVNNASRIYDKIKDNLSFTDLLEFVPPYFYYDYNNIDLTINM